MNNPKIKNSTLKISTIEKNLNYATPIFLIPTLYLNYNLINQIQTILKLIKSFNLLK